MARFFLKLCFPQFVGYDVGNNMIHANGTMTSMFPMEGGLVCCEKTEFINGKYLLQ